MPFCLKFHTHPDWTKEVLNDFDTFLLDHATAEKKASGMAMSMVSHYPDKPDLVAAMIDLAIEELTHFKQVTRVIYQRGLTLSADAKDPYVNALRGLMRSGKDDYFLDRLLIASIIEARGHERFGLIAKALEPGKLKQFYQAITTSEGRHKDLFTKLAYQYFDKNSVTSRLENLLDHEAAIVKELPIRSGLH